MFVLHGKKISIAAPFTDSAGFSHPNLLDPAVRARLGVVEVPDPSDVVEHNATIDALITEVEGPFPRQVRELLVMLCEKAMNPSELAASAPYKKLKDLDAKIAALRLKRK